MNVTTPPPVGAPGSTTDRAGELIAVWPVGPGALLLLGRCPGPIPAEGVAQLERRRADRGPFRACAWPSEGQRAFVAAIRLPAATTPLPGQAMVLADGGAHGVALRLPAAFTDGADFAAAAASLGGDGASGLVRFLFDTFPVPTLARAPEVAAMLADLLGRIATDDGVIEVMGGVPAEGRDGCAFLQGWGTVVPDGTQVLLAGDAVRRFAAHSARFARPDIVAPATGVVLVLPAAAVELLGGLQAAFLVTATAVLRWRPVDRRVLGPADSLGHVRDILPSLRCEPAAADCLRGVLRARYQGRETLSELAHPVRAAIDLAASADGDRFAGAYLAGWLFDPLELVASVHLRGRGAARLDDRWTRIARPDVGEAFAAHGLPRGSDDDHGFAVFASDPSLASGTGRADWHLEIELKDGSAGFVPVALADPRQPGWREKLLDSVDLFKPSGLPIVERQLGPALLAAIRPKPPLAGVAIEDGTVLVVPLTGPPVMPRAFLSQFLHDPLQPDEAMIFVCGPLWDEGAAQRLERMLAFAGLDGRVLRGPGSDSGAALDLALAATRARWMLLVGPDTVGAAPGWRAALAEAVAEPELACACPTLLYEEGSIRFAGIGGIRTLPTAPYAVPMRALAGFPAAAAPAGPALPTTIGTLQCCLMPRAALAAAGGARHGGLTEAGREAAFFRRLRAVGADVLWVRRARIHALEQAAEPHGREAVASLADGWCLRQWQTEEITCAS